MTRSPGGAAVGPGDVARGLGAAGRPAGGAAAGSRSTARNPETGVSVPSPDGSWAPGSPRPYEPAGGPGRAPGGAPPGTACSPSPGAPGAAPAGAACSSSPGTPGAAPAGAACSSSRGASGVPSPGTSAPPPPPVSQGGSAASCPYTPVGRSSGNGGGEKGGMSVSEVAAMYSVKDPLLKSGAYSSKGSSWYSVACSACAVPAPDPGWTASGAPEWPSGRTFAPQRLQNSAPGEMACPLPQVHTGPRSRSPLSITRPASVPILGHVSPACRRVGQGVIRSPGEGVRSRPAHAISPGRPLAQT